MERDDAADAFGWGCGQRTEQQDARIADEHPDFDAARRGFGMEFHGGIRFRKVHAERQRAHAVTRRNFPGRGAIPAITKSYPFAASCAAYSRPIPDEAPVTNAYFRCREEIISNNLLLLRGLKICILCFGVSPPFCCSSSPTPL